MCKTFDQYCIVLLVILGKVFRFHDVGFKSWYFHTLDDQAPNALFLVYRLKSVWALKMKFVAPRMYFSEVSVGLNLTTLFLFFVYSIFTSGIFWAYFFRTITTLSGNTHLKEQNTLMRALWAYTRVTNKPEGRRREGFGCSRQMTKKIFCFEYYNIQYHVRLYSTTTHVLSEKSNGWIFPSSNTSCLNFRTLKGYKKYMYL